ncbi:MAG: hypothetical protein HOO92_06755 [Methylococcaceae bacterium]|nr:hypothetical protein [Methylococcaceae bacterium]
MEKTRALTALGILTVTFISQLAGHLLLKQYMPNAAVGGIGFLLVAFLFAYVLFWRRDTFGFILVVYLCSHFSYAENQGGLWNLMAFGMLSLFFLMSSQRHVGSRQKDHVMSFLLGIFILWNILGWVMKNPLPLVPRLQGIAAFFGFLLMYKLASNLVITRERVRLFLTITFFMVLYQFVVALNQRYTWVTWNTPLFGGYSEFGSLLTHREVNSSGTLRHFELFGEYGLLLTCLLIPLLSSSSIQQEVKYSSNWILLMIFLCLSFIMLTSNRAAAILVVLAIVMYYLVFAVRYFSAIDRVSRQSRLILIVVLLVPVIGVYVGLDHLQKDFASLAPSLHRLSLEGFVSGKDINRGGTVSAAMQRLYSESWVVGYGYGVPRSNQWAWFDIDPYKLLDVSKTAIRVSDFHSLYLSLPELFGWTGSLAFIAMIVVTGFRLFTLILKHRRRKGFLMVLAIGFTMFWAVFLVNEYKISIFRNPNYQMLFWIWLGLSNSIINNIKSEVKSEKPPITTVSFGRQAGAGS